jgi:hypothetical protein
MITGRASGPHLVSREQEEELGAALGTLGKVFNLYRAQLGELIASKTKDEWGPQMVTKGLGIDEQTNLFTRFSKLFENPASIELFHKKAISTFADFLDKDPDFIKETDHLVEEQDKITKKVNDLAGDKIQHMMIKISGYLTRELERLSLVLIRLYEEEELDMIIQEKRIRGVKKFMRQARYIKMDIQSQIKVIEAERRDVLEALTYMTDPNPTGTVTRDTAEDYLTEYLKKYADKKDFVYTLFEDNLLDYLARQITTSYKEHSMKAFSSYLSMLPYTMYLRDYSFAVDRYMTNFLVKGSCYISSKKAASHQRSEGLLSVNLLEQICRFSTANPHGLLKYASNHSFDNLTVAADTVDIIYPSYTCAPPKVILVIKNLFGAYLDEVDNSDNLVYENSLDIPLTLLRNVGQELRADVVRGVFGGMPTSIITAEMAQVKRTDFLSSIFVKFDTERRLVEAMHTEVNVNIAKVYSVQGKYFRFFDYEDVDKLIIFSDTRFKLKEKSNPNQAYLDDINNLRSKDILKIKKIPDRFLQLADYKFASSCPKDLPIHPATSTILQSLLLNSLELVKERHDIYCTQRLQESCTKLGTDTDETKFKEVAEAIYSTGFNSMFIMSRNSLIQIMSCINYFRSVSLAIGRRSEAIQKLQENAENVEKLRFDNLKGLVRKRERSKEVSIKDDSAYETFRRDKTERRRSTIIERDEDLEFEPSANPNSPNPGTTIKTQRSNEGSASFEPERATWRPDVTGMSPSEIPKIKGFKKVYDKTLNKGKQD